MHVCVRRRELYHVQRELLRERTRCKALEEELENPMNIHRWRKLEVNRLCCQAVSDEKKLNYPQGSDPSTYEMVQKIHTLQRKLIQKTEEVCLYMYASILCLLLLHFYTSIRW